ncbi:MAG: glycosyltransferase [Hydrogenophaga sp.]|uniref:glycosyltransferase n=1 Tax=Hydrogenophaga sp. TaxID=1904254 RepID=UPI00271FCAB3|nr:glycosyltransferase [Hydrogenophaga sp.]MDO9571495.1 glycosyltransferase [Hydrogenophaga sp.]MDP3376294.1 glycosyltransferase [Hydrogenophaga sp.]
MKTLADLYQNHTGKVSDKWSLYLSEYDRLFTPYREQPISLLEIGVQNGGSLEIWSQFLINGTKFVGCDINPDCAKLTYEDPRITVIVGDATTNDTQHKIHQQSATFDLIIEDGSHTSGDIVKAFAQYFPALRDGGLFVAEDLHCSYWQEFDGAIYYPFSSVNFFKLLADVINHEHWGVEKTRTALISGFKEKFQVEISERTLAQIHSVEFLNSMCVIKKNNPKINQLGSRIIAGTDESVASGHLYFIDSEINVQPQSNNYWANLSTSPAESFQVLTAAIAERDGLIRCLNHQKYEQQEELNRLYLSNSLKITKPFRWLRRKIHLSAHAIRLARQYIGNHGGLVSGGLMMLRRSLDIISASGFKGFMQRLRDYSNSSSSRSYVLPVPATVSPLSLSDQEIENLRYPYPNDQDLLHPQTLGQGYRFWKTYNLPTSVDVIVCVHNALDDVRNCLSSIVRHSPSQCGIVIVDDGSRDDTRDYLLNFCKEQGAILLRNEEAKGYTFAANQGMRTSTAGYLILLNSDTIVTPGWIEKMVACAESDSKIGLVGPLSNTASWQSIPEIEKDGDWATNPLPEAVSIEEMGGLVAKYSGQTYPRMSFLNGFCLLIRRDVIDKIGQFDEETFGRGYGEENDYCLRARKAGWSLALADDAYVYHEQSKSYSHEKRKLLADHAGMQLTAKHGSEIIAQGVDQCRWDRSLISIRARTAANFIREMVTSRARAAWEGKRILFVLPIMHAGGGGNVVITEALTMMRMGVGVTLLNLATHKRAFEKSYPNLDIPLIYVDSGADIPRHAVGFDAVIATANHSVQWIAPLQTVPNGPVLGYYIQDFEPYFFNVGTDAYKTALASYSLVPKMRLFTKTEWNRNEVLAKTGRSPVVVGVSFDADLFFPRRREQGFQNGAVHIVAMVRPSSPRRNAEGTITALAKIKAAFGDRVAVSIFGTEKDGPPIPWGNADTKFANYGQLTPQKTAQLLSSADLFIDMSHFQAMGLTAMEAMACGAIPILPQAGGATSFAQHSVNALIVDTSDIDAVVAAASTLINSDDQRRRMQSVALASAALFFPEKPASVILETLFQ